MCCVLTVPAAKRVNYTTLLMLWMALKGVNYALWLMLLLISNINKDVCLLFYEVIKVVLKLTLFALVQ